MRRFPTNPFQVAVAFKLQRFGMMSVVLVLRASMSLGQQLSNPWQMFVF